MQDSRRNSRCWRLAPPRGLRTALGVVGLAALAFGAPDASARANPVRVGVKTNVPLTQAVVNTLGRYGQVGRRMWGIDTVDMTVDAGDLDALRRSGVVKFVESEQPIELYGSADVGVPDFSDGISSWDLDIIDVTDFGAGRTVDQDGDGVYVAVLDTGLVNNWRDYFPEERIDTHLATSFTGGANERSPWDDRGRAAQNDNTWDKDVHSHGTHVTSTILGFALTPGAPVVNGVAPKATVIPVRVLNQNGYGSNLDIVAGLYYVGWLRESGTVSGRIVVNMSLGVQRPSMNLEDAIDYAIGQGVVVVAAAGNEGETGMGWPGAYPQVISAAATGWKGAWLADPPGAFWRGDVPEEAGTSSESYITSFSSRENDALVPGYDQELDVSAPGLWTLGPYLVNGAAHPPIWAHQSFGRYYFLGGTSMASPHVAGVAALMLQKDSTLTQSEVESILKSTALPIPAGSYVDPLTGEQHDWTSDASEQGSGLIQADGALGAIP